MDLYEVRFYISEKCAIPCTIKAETEDEAREIFCRTHTQKIKSIKKRKPVFEGVVKNIGGM